MTFEVSDLPLGEPIRQAQAMLADALIERQFAAEPELARRLGSSGRDKCTEDALANLSFLADAMHVGNPGLFINYVGWAKVMLAARGVPAEDLARQVESTRLMITERLVGPAAILAEEYLNLGLAGLPALPTEAPTHLENGMPHAALARAYLDALLAGNRHGASVMILDSVAHGISVKDLYIHVLQMAQYEVGRLWQVNQISMAQEHYCTAATQMIMSQLYSHIFAADHHGGTLVATCVAGDLHEIGVRMVADFFEMDGWNTFYLGANMPPAGVIEEIVTRDADVLAISATITAHLRGVADLIARVRASPDCHQVKILVGGRPFSVAPDLWLKMGADGCASDAQSAIDLANRLVPERRH